MVLLGGYADELLLRSLLLTENLRISRWLTIFATFGYTNAFGVYLDLLTRSGTSSASNISWIGSTQLFFLSSMALPAGRLLDKGYFKHIMVIGSVIYVFSYVVIPGFVGKSSEAL